MFYVNYGNATLEISIFHSNSTKTKICGKCFRNSFMSLNKIAKEVFCYIRIVDEHSLPTVVHISYLMDF